MSGLALPVAPGRGAVLAVAAFVVVLWSGTAIANKLAVAEMDAMTAGVLRSMLAGLIAAAIAFAVNRPRPVSMRHWCILLVSGVASFAVWPMLLSWGLGRTTANHAALIMAMIPVFTGLIAAAVDRRLPGVAWWAGVALAIAGTALLVSYRGEGIRFADDASLVGDLAILAGVAICALGYVAGGKLSPVLGTWATTFWGLAMATLVLVPVFALLAPRTDWAAVGTIGWTAIAYMTVLSSIIGYALWFWALGHGGIARIGSTQFTQPVMTIVLAAPLLGEVLTLPLVASGAIILAGVAIAQRARS